MIWILPSGGGSDRINLAYAQGISLIDENGELHPQSAIKAQPIHIYPMSALSGPEQNGLMNSDTISLNRNLPQHSTHTNASDRSRYVHHTPNNSITLQRNTPYTFASTNISATGGGRDGDEVVYLHPKIAPGTGSISGDCDLMFRPSATSFERAGVDDAVYYHKASRVVSDNSMFGQNTSQRYTNALQDRYNMS